MITADSNTVTADSNRVTADGFLQALGALAGKLSIRVVSVVRSIVNLTPVRRLTASDGDS